jgi:hypothetical protein
MLTLAEAPKVPNIKSTKYHTKGYPLIDIYTPPTAYNTSSVLPLCTRATHLISLYLQGVVYN